MGALTLLLAIGGAQAAPAFDVATVKAGASIKDRPSMFANSTGLTYKAVSLRACMAVAYNVKEYQIVGPGWIDSERYDILTKTAGAGTEQLHLMLQTLLSERFKMTFHREKKELPVFARVVGKRGFKLTPVEGEAEAQPAPSYQKGAMVFQRTSMGAFAGYLSRMTGVGRPVLDMTGIQGSYDISLPVSENPNVAGAEIKQAIRDWMDGTLILTEVQELGLKLEPQKAATDVIVIDRAEKIPTEN